MPAQKGTRHKRTPPRKSWKGIPIREKGDLPKDWSIGKDASWMAAKMQGRPSRYTDAEELAAYIEGYFAWNAANPIMSYEVGNFRGRGYLNGKPLRRIATLQGLCGFLGLNASTWQAWKRPDHSLFKPEFVSVIEAAEDMMDADKLEGAASGLYSHHIVARLMGLVDKQETDQNLTVTIDKGDGEL